MVTKNEFENDLQIISKKSDKNEKLAWMRKKKKMDVLLTKLYPIEDSLLKLIGDKQIILDEIAELRKFMIKGCIHAEEYLIHHGNYIECKFCNSKIFINKSSINAI